MSGNNVPFELHQLVQSLAADNFLSIEDIEDTGLTTLMCFETKDLFSGETPDIKQFDGFLIDLHQRRAESPIPIQIEVFSSKGSAIPYDIRKNIPDIEHWIKISTLE